jgi:NAD(P)-dependent dehydrogenase (short-subunit alcohol dehydrogenase family)
VDIDFKDKVAVITGAGAGLGRSHALYLAARGAKVVVNDLGGTWDGKGESQLPAQKVVEEIRDAGGRAEANFDSVADPESAKRIIGTALDVYGTVDILICNAGVLRVKTFHKMPIEDFELIISVHLMGTVYPTKFAFPIMRENGYGRIVFTSSAAGLYGVLGGTNYATAKMGIIGFMNALKLEGQKHNVMINTIAPMASTRLAEMTTVLPEELMPTLRPELVTAMVAYLCSDQCRTTGDILAAGGGYYSKAQMLEGAGVRLNPAEEITAETIAEHFARITDMTEAKGYFSASDELENSLGPLLKG